MLVGEFVRARAERGEWRSPVYPGRELGRAWLVLSATGVAVAAGLATELPDPQAAWGPITAALAALVIAAARSARALDRPWMREASALIGLAALASAGYSFALAPVTMAGTGVVTALMASFAALSVWGRSMASPWLRPCAVLGIGASVLATIVALVAGPAHDIVAAALLVLSGQMIAAGVTLRRPLVLSTAPLLLLGVWLIVVVQSVSGSVASYTIPVAAAVIGEVEIARWANRLGGRAASPPPLLVLEWVALGTMAAPPLTELFTRGPGAAVTVALVAATVMLWGIITQVRRRIVAGAALATATAVLMVAATVAGQAPASAFLWIVIAGAGFTVMLIVALVEAYRSRSGRFMARLDALTADWEA